MHPIQFSSALPIKATRVMQVGLPSKAIRSAIPQQLGKDIFRAGGLTRFSGIPSPKPLQETAPGEVRAFGTAGFRTANLTAADVAKVVHAAADYAIQQIEQTGKANPVLLCWDTRESSRQFAPLAAQLLTSRGLDIYQPDEPISTPVASFATRHFSRLAPQHPGVALTVMLTASHNPYQQGGIKVLNDKGVNISEADTRQIEAFQQKPLNQNLDRKTLKLPEQPQVTAINPYPAYNQQLAQLIDFDAIKQSGIKIGVDTHYGTGYHFYEFLKSKGLPVEGIRTDKQPPKGYNGASEPTPENLKPLCDLVRKKQLHIGVAPDGDGDRGAGVDETGKLIPFNDVLGLGLLYMMNTKKQFGVLARSQATSHFLDALYEHLAKQQGDISKIEIIETPVGFKYLGGLIDEHHRQGKTPVLLAGESSGGMTSSQHAVWDKDGSFTNAILIATAAQNPSTPISQKIQQMKDLLPLKYTFTELSITTTNPVKQLIIEHFTQLAKTGGHIGGSKIDTATTQQKADALKQRYGTTDGVKIYLDNGSWLLVRASGTEPKVRIYIEGVGKTAEGSHKQEQAIRSNIEQTLNQFKAKGDPNLTIKMQT